MNPTTMWWRVVILLCWCVRSEPSSAAPRPPNIILILIDDSGYSDLTGEHISTPHIKKLFQESTEFLNAYVTAPQCSPSRVALLTGIYHQRLGQESNDEFVVGLSHPNVSIIPRYLPPEYSSAAIGKWNLGDIPNSPVSKGFSKQFLYRNCDEAFAAHRTMPFNDINVSGVEYRTSIMFQTATSYIREHSRQPFFLYFAPMSPHPPYVYPPHYEALYSKFNTTTHSKVRKKVLTMTKELDDGIGTILATLRELQLDERTVIFFLNDNGAPDTSSRTDHYNSNYPLTGYKGDLHEGGIHVRFAVRWAGHVRGGVTKIERVSSLDILPTIIDVTRRFHVSLKHNVLDGRSLVDLLGIGGESGMVRSRRKRELFWRFSMNCKPVKKAMIRGDLKLIQIEYQYSRLYNLSSDITESIDMSETYPDLVDELSGVLDSWVSALPPLPPRKNKATCDKMPKRYA